MNNSEGLFFKVYIEDVVNFNQTLNDLDIAIYTYLSYSLFPSREEVFTSLAVLYKNIDTDIYKETDKDTIAKVKKSLLKLSSLGLFEIEGELKNRNTIFKISNLKEGRFFASVYIEDYKKLLKIEGVNNNKLIRYYMTILSTINSNHRVGWTTTNNLSHITKLDINTIYKFNSILEQNGLLYIKRDKAYLKDDLFINRFPNVYGRYRDKAKVRNFSYLSFAS